MGVRRAAADRAALVEQVLYGPDGTADDGNVSLVDVAELARRELADQRRAESPARERPEPFAALAEQPPGEVASPIKQFFDDVDDPPEGRLETFDDELAGGGERVVDALASPSPDRLLTHRAHSVTFSGSLPTSTR